MPSKEELDRMEMLTGMEPELVIAMVRGEKLPFRIHYNEEGRGYQEAQIREALACLCPVTGKKRSVPPTRKEGYGATEEMEAF